MLIIDFGSQLTQLLARRVRESGRYCEILPHDADPKRFLDARPQAIILSGSGESTLHAAPPALAAEIFELDCPVLGVCYGMQVLAAHLGGRVEAAAPEFGHAVATVTTAGQTHPLFAGLDAADGLPVWMSHGDAVTEVPEGFEVLASTENCAIAAMADSRRRLFGVQFHPEVTETACGAALLDNFLGRIAACPKNWTPGQIVSELVSDVQARVGPEEEVLLALSGGVDSSVVACLLHRALGPRLHCVMVDTGLLRLNEAEEVKAAFAHFNKDLNITVVNAADTFLAKLKGVTDPEAKRKKIGHLFVHCFEEFVSSKQFGKHAEHRQDQDNKNIDDGNNSQNGNNNQDGNNSQDGSKTKAGRRSSKDIRSRVKWLAQGTIYPDVIESAGTGKSALIKSHHNVGGLPEKMKLRLLEPVRKLFKDEVRRVGLELGLPAAFVWRHPFPGPGLGVRILGEVTAAGAEKLRRADAIFLEELRAAGLYDQTSQAFAVLLPVKSVAVKGDARAYDQVVALRAVETVDFMTARAAELPYTLIKTVARRICNEVPGVSRVVYDLSDKPPGTIEWE